MRAWLPLERRSLAIRRDLQAAVDAPAINAVLLNIDSPGGEAARRRAWASFRGVKPIVAYAGDLAASAGYWLASAADSIVIGAGARRHRRAGHLFAGTLAKLAGGKAPARRASAPEGPAPRIGEHDGMPTAPG